MFSWSHDVNERPAAGENFVAERLHQRFEKGGTPAGQAPEERRQSRGGIAFQHRDVVHSIETRQLGFEMSHRAQVRVPRVEKTKGALQQMEKLRHRMFRLGADVDQFHKVRSRLHAEIIFADAAKRIAQYRLCQSMQIRLPATLDLNLDFEKKSSLPAKTLFGRRAPFATVSMQPNDSVHQETIRLVSLSFRLRSRIALVVSNFLCLFRFFWRRGKCLIKMLDLNLSA